MRGRAVLTGTVPAVALLALGLLLALPATAAEPAGPFRDCAECPEMVRVPAGTFVMGTPTADAHVASTRAESQAVIVAIARPFALGKV